MTRGSEKVTRKVFALLFLSFVFLFLPCLFSVHTAFSQTGDAIAVRVLPNPEHYSPMTWYQKQGFKGSPIPIKVDGYEAVRDGRTVYVNVANVAGSDLYTNIYLISYNQDATPETLSIFDNILSKWRFNSNLTTPGKCSDEVNGTASDAKTCLADSDCPSGLFCDSEKARLVRDIKRLGDVVDLREKVEEYAKKYGKYPVLSAGTYLPGITVSTWPSWNTELANALGTQPPIDPVNKLGKCDSSYDPTTCWNDQAKSFADSDPIDPSINLPASSSAFIYQVLDNGESYNACAYMESGLLVDGSLGACRGSYNANQPPTVDCGSLMAIVGQPFEGYITAHDVDDANVTLVVMSYPTSFSIESAGSNASKHIYSSSVSAPGTYTFSGYAIDEHSNYGFFNCSVNAQDEAFITYPVANQRVLVGKPINFSVYVNHSEDDYSGLSYNFSEDLSRRSISCNSGTPIRLSDGRYKCDISFTLTSPSTLGFTVNATNGSGDTSTSQHFTVEAYNNPPVMNALKCDNLVRVSRYPSGGAPGHYDYSCKLSAVDPDGHRISSFHVDPTPPGMTVYLNPDGTGSLAGFPSTISTAGNYKISISATDEFGATGDSVTLPLKIADFCGDEQKQTPNMEGKGGPRDDGFEDCDDHNGTPWPYQSNISWQYGCNSSTCTSLHDGWCGDEVAQDGLSSLLGVEESEIVDGTNRIYTHYPANYGEQCDDGNNINGDGCNTYVSGVASCKWQCGDGTTNDGLHTYFPEGFENIDLPLWGRKTYYHSVDTSNNSVGQVEECDDGNTIDGDGCNTFSANCRFVCGDGRLNTDKDEQCEVVRRDANTAEELDGRTCKNFYGPISGRAWEGGSLHCTASSCRYDTGHCVYYDDVSGHVGQALNGSPARNVLVSITYDGVTYSAQSDANGYFTIKNVPHRAPTTHTIVTSGGDCSYADRSKSGTTNCLGTSETRVMNGPITYNPSGGPNIELYVFPSDWSGQYAFVLSWNGPKDLDAHLKYGSNHVYYQARTAPGASLDWDDLTTNGHEVISLSSWEVGQDYYLYVHNYGHEFSGGGAFNNQVNVKYFNRTGSGTYLIGQSNYGCSNTSQNYWETLAFTGMAGTIQPITQIGSCGDGTTVTITGTVINALTGDVISGAKASLEYTNKEGKNYEAFSDANGVFTIANIPNRDLIGVTKKMVVSATGFRDTSEDLSLSVSGPNKEYYLFPSGWNGQFAIVLNWNTPPLDLDAHLKFSTCDISYSNKGVMCSGLMLDRDDQNSTSQTPPDNNLNKGQETISMYTTYVAPGGEALNLYNYYVYNYSGGTFPNTATVRLFYLNNLGKAELLRECKASNHAERYWSVFKFYASFGEPSNSFYNLTGRNSIICQDVYSSTVP